MSGTGIEYTFDIHDISLMDINKLIDKGRRFSLSTNPEECDDLERSLEDEHM